MDGIAFDDQLPSDEVDREENCAVVLAAMEDEGLPGVEDKVVRSIGDFVEAFFLKMRASIPGKLLKALKTLQPMNLKSAEVKDGKSCHWISSMKLLMCSVICHITVIKKYRLNLLHV